MAILVPTNALSRVDLPTLVRPTSTAKPVLKFLGVSIYGHCNRKWMRMNTNLWLRGKVTGGEFHLFLLRGRGIGTNCICNDLEGKTGGQATARVGGRD